MQSDERVNTDGVDAAGDMSPVEDENNSKVFDCDVGKVTSDCQNSTIVDSWAEDRDTKIDVDFSKNRVAMGHVCCVVWSYMKRTLCGLGMTSAVHADSCVYDKELEADPQICDCLRKNAVKKLSK